MTAPALIFASEYFSNATFARWFCGPGIITAVIFVAIPILGEYLTPQIVGGTKGVMIGNLIANFFQVGQFTRGAAASLIIAAFIFLVLAVFRRSLSTPEAYGG